MIAVYIAILVVVSIISNKKTKSLNDFFLGGRNMGPWMSAFAYGTTYFSAVMFVGYAGKLGWAFGISATWIGIANALIGTMLAWILLAKPTRRMTHKLDSKTMPEFFESRYNSKAMKIVSAIIIFIFLVPYSASVYQGLSYFFEAVFGLPFSYAMIGMALLTAVYLLFGGYIATALMDAVQGFIMLVGVILMVLFIVNSEVVGGVTSGLQKISQIDPFLAAPFGSPKTALTLISLIILTSLGAWGLPQMVHKFYAIKSEQAVKTGTIVSTIFALVVAGAGYFIGTFGRLFLNNTPPTDAATGAVDFEMVMPQVVQAALPEVMVGLILILILAASMSTLSSLVLVSSSAIAIDLVKAVKPQIKDKTSMLIIRCLCGLFILLSLIVALDKTAIIITLMSYSWGALAGAFLGPFVLGVTWKGTTKTGAWTGMVGGLIIMLSLVLITKAGYWTILSAPAIGSIAMIMSVVLTFIVSLFTKKFDKEQVDSLFA